MKALPNGKHIKHCLHGLRCWQLEIGWYFSFALESVGLACNIDRSSDRRYAQKISFPIQGCLGRRFHDYFGKALSC